MSGYIQSAIVNRPFCFGKPVEYTFDAHIPGRVNSHRVATTTKTQAVALQGKLILNAIADYTGKLSYVFTVVRHFDDVLPAINNNGRFDASIYLFRKGTELSDGNECINDLQGLVNGDVLEEIQNGKTAMLQGRVYLAVANLISLGFFLQSMKLVQFKAVWITSDLIPSWSLGLINYISNHSATTAVTGYLPESWRQGVTDGAGRFIALPLSNVLRAIAGIGYASFFGLATLQAYRDKNTLNMAAFGSKFVNVTVGLVGVQNQYVKAALGLTCMATNAYKNYRNLNG